MSHFTVLSAIAFPEDVPTALGAIPDNALAAYTQSRFALDLFGRTPDTTAPMLSIPPITGQTRTEVMVEDLVGSQLEPYWENTEDPEYLEFTDMTDGCRQEYEEGGVDCVRMPDGRILLSYDSKFASQYELRDGIVYKKRYGPLHHRKRTRNAARIRPLPNYPFKKLYPSFEAFMTKHHGYELCEETGGYGYYFNPNAKWDWYQIGGRWPFRFLVKEDCPISVEGEYSRTRYGEKPAVQAPEGYRWVAGARKCDIAWDAMQTFFRENETKRFQQYEQWFLAGAIPEELGWSLVLSEEGIASWGDLLYHKGETLEEHLRRNGISEEYPPPISTFAVVDDDGWESFGDMGWFGISSNNKDQLLWNKMVEAFIERQPDDMLLVSVDCHS